MSLTSDTTTLGNIYLPKKDEDEPRGKTFACTADCIIQHSSRIYSEQIDINGAAITSESGRADRLQGLQLYFRICIHKYLFFLGLQKRKISRT